MFGISATFFIRLKNRLSSYFTRKTKYVWDFRDFLYSSEKSVVVIPNSFFSDIFKEVCTFYRVRQIPFFGKNFKKTTEYFLKFLFYLKIQSFRIIMKNCISPMASRILSFQASIVSGLSA